MKLLSVELEHIFAYDSKVVVDLDVVTPGKNVVLIWGRNGMGKTSFLNSLKLLFRGAQSEQMRTVGFPPRKLPIGQYVLGDNLNWSGVINRHALLRARNAGRAVTARVKARFEIAGGLEITAERQWTTTGSGYTELLSVSDGQELLKGDAAEDRLKDLMPPEYVGFFFFDGDDIKQLAETAERKQIDFDRLLRITFIQEVADQLRVLASERGRDRVSEPLRKKIGEIEVALKQVQVDRRNAQQTLADLEDQIATGDAEFRRLTARRENLSVGASEAEHAEMEKRRNQLTKQLREAQDEVAESVPANAPALANLNLVELAAKALAERLSVAGVSEQVLARRIQHELPVWIAEAPIQLTPDAVRGLAMNLSRRIDDLVAPQSGSGLFGRLDPSRAERISKHLQRILWVGADQRKNQVRQLATVRRLRREIAESEEALMQLEVGSQYNLEEYRRVVKAIQALQVRLDELKDQRGQTRAELQKSDTEERQLSNQLRERRSEEEIALKLVEEARFILEVASAMDDLRDVLRRTKRQEVEDAINKRFQELVYDHNIIDHIKIDDNYTLAFLDDSGQGIGRASLSSGLKQLAATALLWAMKDAVGEDMPVVIDTPLGRIDRENQNQMLTNYYPRLSSQVILLPTNSEIDDRKLDYLLPIIAEQYTITRSLGDSGATIRQNSLVGRI